MAVPPGACPPGAPLPLVLGLPFGGLLAGWLEALTPSPHSPLPVAPVELSAFQSLSEGEKKRKRRVGEALGRCFEGTVKPDCEHTHQDRRLRKSQMGGLHGSRNVPARRLRPCQRALPPPHTKAPLSAGRFGARPRVPTPEDHAPGLHAVTENHTWAHPEEVLRGREGNLRRERARPEQRALAGLGLRGQCEGLGPMTQRLHGGSPAPVCWAAVSLSLGSGLPCGQEVCGEACAGFARGLGWSLALCVPA